MFAIVFNWNSIVGHSFMMSRKKQQHRSRFFLHRHASSIFRPRLQSMDQQNSSKILAKFLDTSAPSISLSLKSVVMF